MYFDCKTLAYRNKEYIESREDVTGIRGVAKLPKNLIPEKVGTRCLRYWQRVYGFEDTEIGRTRVQWRKFAGKNIEHIISFDGKAFSIDLTSKWFIDRKLDASAWDDALKERCTITFNKIMFYHLNKLRNTFTVMPKDDLDLCLVQARLFNTDAEIRKSLVSDTASINIVKVATFLETIKSVPDILLATINTKV